MRPTLYADELGLVLPQALSDDSVERLSEFMLETMEPLRRILPLRCPLCSPHVSSYGPGWTLQSRAAIWKNPTATGPWSDMTIGCPRCGGDWGSKNGGTPGRGWLYPDTPDRFNGDEGHTAEQDWRRNLDDIWRSMGILKEDNNVDK